MRRYIVNIAPVEHMNGKLAPASYVCHNQPDTDISDVSFFYGYRYSSRPWISRYALRDRARNLEEHPYTQGEEQSKQMFSECVEQARTMLQSIEWRPKIVAAFNKQRQYIRLYNYTVAMLVTYKKAIPPEWLQ